jgi:tetratricopeptide (TPR) repeat protein
MSPDDDEGFLAVEDSEYGVLDTRDAAAAWRKMTQAWARNDSFGNSKEYLNPAIRRRNERVRRLIDAELRRHPRNAEAWALRAALPWRKDFPAVKADFDRAWKLGLRSSALLIWRGTARLKMLDREGGLADLEASLRLPDASAWNWAWTGRALLTQFRDRKGLSYLDRAAELAPRWAKVYVWRAEARRHFGDLEGMSADYERALSLKPGRGLRDLLRGFHGMGLLSLGRVDEAIAELELALKATPRRTLWLHGLSTAWRRKGRLDLWISYLDRAARLDLKYENMPGGWTPPAREAALRDLETLVARAPGDALARRWRAKLLLAAGRPAEAEADLEAAARAEPRRAENWLWLAEARRARGGAREALAALERAARLKTRGEEIAVARGRLQAELGEAAAALKSYEAAIKLEKRHALAHAERGALLLRLGRGREALAALETAAALTGRDARGLADLSVARRRAGDARGAKEALARARAIDAALADARLESWQRAGR